MRKRSFISSFGYGYDDGRIKYGRRFSFEVSTKNEADVIEQHISGFLEVEGLERPLAEKLVHWGIYSLGDFFRRPSLYLAEILQEDQGTISQLQNRARELMLRKGADVWD